MAEDAINKAIEVADSTDKKCTTKELKIQNSKFKNIADIVQENPEFAEKLHIDFSYQKADVVNAVRNEMARTVEDVLARRTRILFLDAKAAIEISQKVAEIMADELVKDEKWIDEQVKEFKRVAENYLVL
jgi:glycerol-3-phosphate dehydrogenase